MYLPSLRTNAASIPEGQCGAGFEPIEKGIFDGNQPCFREDRHREYDLDCGESGVQMNG
jgi:hypothetical protein